MTINSNATHVDVRAFESIPYLYNETNGLAGIEYRLLDVLIGKLNLDVNFRFSSAEEGSVQR